MLSMRALDEPLGLFMHVLILSQLRMFEPPGVWPNLVIPGLVHERRECDTTGNSETRPTDASSLLRVPGRCIFLNGNHDDYVPWCARCAVQTLMKSDDIKHTLPDTLSLPTVNHLFKDVPILFAYTIRLVLYSFRTTSS